MYQSMVRFGFIIHDAPIFVLNIFMELFRACFGLSYLSAIRYSFSLCVPKEGISRQQAENTAPQVCTALTHMEKQRVRALQPNKGWNQIPCFASDGSLEK